MPWGLGTLVAFGSFRLRQIVTHLLLNILVRNFVSSNR